MECKRIFFFFLFSLNFFVVAQIPLTHYGTQGSVQGVTLNEQRKPLSNVTVSLCRQADSTVIQEISTNQDGAFRFCVPFGEYYIGFLNMGYQQSRRNVTLSSQKSEISLGEVLLSTKEIKLQEVVIQGIGSSIMLKGDTIEYNALAFAPEESDVLKDLLSRIPDMEIDEKGNVTVNGRRIKKILVDGREFFGNNIRTALEKLPATMIKRIQLYKKQSETSLLTGFKDKNPGDVLNLEIREEAKKSTFGDVKSAYGAKKRYAFGLNVFSMQDENQYALTGDINNSSDGISYSKAALDYGVNEKKLEVTANPTFSKGSLQSNAGYFGNKNLSEVQTDIFYPSINRNNQNSSTEKKQKDGFNFGSIFKWNPDSLTIFNFTTRYNLSDSRNESISKTITFETDKDTTKEETNNWEQVRDYQWDNTFEIARKIGETGRSFTLKLGNSINNSNGYGANLSEVTYAGALSAEKIDQVKNEKQKELSYTAEAHYILPLGKNKLLNAGYGFGQKNSKQESDVRKKDAQGYYTVLDSAYARNTHYDDYNHNISLDFQLSGEKSTFQAGLNVKPSVIKNQIEIGTLLIDKQVQRIVDFASTIGFEQQQTRKLPAINIRYTGTTAHANVRQLSPDTVIESTLSKNYGNPLLKMSLTNSIPYSFSWTKPKSSLTLSGEESFTINDIASNTITDNIGNSVTTYCNVNGKRSHDISLNYEVRKPLKTGTWFFSGNQTLLVQKIVGFLNNEQSTLENRILEEYVKVAYTSKSKNKLRTNISVHFLDEMTQSPLSETQNSHTNTLKIGNSTGCVLPYNFRVLTSFDYVQYWGYRENLKNKEYIWNLSLSRSFLRNRLTFGFDATDILNRKNQVERMITDNGIYTVRGNRIGRYSLFTVSYKFKSKTKAGN